MDTARAELHIVRYAHGIGLANLALCCRVGDKIHFCDSVIDMPENTTSIVRVTSDLVRSKTYLHVLLRDIESLYLHMIQINIEVRRLCHMRVAHMHAHILQPCRR